jgi:hypothetical protein
MTPLAPQSAAGAVTAIAVLVGFTVLAFLVAGVL